MSLLTAHKILIASAIALFVLYAGWEIDNYTANDDIWALPRAAASAVAAIGFAVYLRSVWDRGAL
ncbi:MAG TPA: hypothetical protein VL403_07500 [Candidatus Kryptonia bacterium]|nr:hypothetical protein [Candidatus Kryptonia bacterium]